LAAALDVDAHGVESVLRRLEAEGLVLGIRRSPSLKLWFSTEDLDRHGERGNWSTAVSRSPALDPGRSISSKRVNRRPARTPGRIRRALGWLRRDVQKSFEVRVR
jgi:hypothetical protein